MRRTPFTAFALLALCAALLAPARAAQAQTARTKTSTPSLITGARVAAAEGRYSGPLYVTVGGREKKIAEEAVEAWIIQGGRKVVYSGRDGAGGFENEGQSLRVYDARTGERRKIMSEYYAITKVSEATTSKNKTVLLVEMADGGLGASYVAVVDPARGEVFFRRWAKIISRQGDVVVIGHYREDDWDKFNENENAKVTPYKTERQNLNTVLRGRVIYNKPSK
jgi:hypothetical protein